MLGKLFKRKKELKPSNELKVAIVDEASHDLYLNFGIIDERRDELIELTLAAFKNHSRLHNSYDEIVSQCKHVNEIIVCTIIFERKLVHQKENPLALLEKLFGGE
jgi:hypothetical protein